MGARSLSRSIQRTWRCAVALSATAALVVFYGSLQACDAQLRSLGDDGADGGEDAGDIDVEDGDDGHDASDAADGAVHCAHGSPFQSARLVRGLEDVNVVSARLTPDEQTIYLSIPARPGTFVDFDLYTAGRLSPLDAFGPTTKLSLSTTSDDYWPTTSPDGTIMFFESGALLDGGLGHQSRIWFASRSTVPGNFTATIWDYFANLPAPVHESSPYLSPSGRTLYWTSIRRGGRVSLDVWAADVTKGGTVANDYPLPINSDTEDEMFPVISSDDRELFFCRAPVGTTHDIFVSERSSALDGTFTKAAKVDGPVNTPDAAEWSSWLSPDDCRLYFVRKTTAEDGGLSARLWVAERKRDP